MKFFPGYQTPRGAGFLFLHFWIPATLLIFYKRALVSFPFHKTVHSQFNTPYRVFSHDVTAAILVSQNNETAAMLVSQTNPVGFELFSYANAFSCFDKFA